jgi:pilus assembly protein CpaE
MAHHESGLDILGASADESLPPNADINTTQLHTLLDLLARQHDQIIIDLPRRIDPATSLVLERAHRIALIVQQSVAVLRDASRLMNALRKNLAIGTERIVTVVNRYDKHATITSNDILRTLSVTELALIPNDYLTVSESIETGRPLLVNARSKAITKAIARLRERLEYDAPPARPSLFARALSQLIPSSQS